MEIIHGSKFDASNPVSIYKVTIINHELREVRAVVKVGNHILQINDVIESRFIGRNSFAQKWQVIEVKERFTPQGNFNIDTENIGVICVVRSYVELTDDKENESRND